MLNMWRLYFYYIFLCLGEGKRELLNMQNCNEGVFFMYAKLIKKTL